LESTRLYRRIAELLETRIDQEMFPASLPNNRRSPDVGTRGSYCPLEVTGRVAIRQGHGVKVLLGAQRPAAQNPPDVDIGPIRECALLV
jgi:hypothetical protein